jgi:hypothetical protein
MSLSTSSLTVGKAGSSGGSLARSSVDLNVITCGYLHEKARTEAGVDIHIRYRFLRNRLRTSAWVGKK